MYEIVDYSMDTEFNLGPCSSFKEVFEARAASSKVETKKIESNLEFHCLCNVIYVEVQTVDTYMYHISKESHVWNLQKTS